jgi:hypothetical protein
MRHGLILLLLAISSCEALGQSANPSGITVTVKSVSPAVDGFNITVEVKNLGARSVILQLSPEPAGNPRLQSLSVEQWDATLGWQNVGPCRDVEGESALKLSPQQKALDIVPIGDVAHGWSSALCPRKIQHLSGKIRAVLTCTYHSMTEFKKRRGIEGCQRVESLSSELPK